MSGDGTLIYWDLINRHMWGVNGYEWSACSVDCGTSWKRQKRKKWMRMSPRPSITPRADPNVLPDACGLSTLTRDRSLLKSDRVPRNQARLLISCSAWLIAPPGCLSFSGQRLCLSQPPILGNQGTHHSRYTWLGICQPNACTLNLWYDFCIQQYSYPELDCAFVEILCKC